MIRFGRSAGIGLVLAAHGLAGAGPLAWAADDTTWTVSYSPSLPPALSRNAEGYFFDFPTRYGVHYVTRRASSVRMGQTITMVFSLQGTGKLVATEGRSAAKVRLFLQRQGDTLTAQEPYKRWWSLPHVELVSPRSFTLSVKIDPREWSSVFGVRGNAAPAEFADCIANLENVGFTFGGDFAGHGVDVNGGAVRFILKEYSAR